MKIAKGWIFYILSVGILATMLVISAVTSSDASSITTGEGVYYGDDAKKGRVEACIFNGNKDYSDPTWISEVMAPLDSLAKGGASLVQLPVYLIRSIERPTEQAMSGKRQDAANCFRTKLRDGDDFSASYTLEGYHAETSGGDTFSADSVTFTVEIDSDTK